MSGTTFDPGVEYVISVDTDADAVADIEYMIIFAAEADGTQASTVTKEYTAEDADAHGAAVAEGLLPNTRVYDTTGAAASPTAAPWPMT